MVLLYQVKSQTSFSSLVEVARNPSIQMCQLPNKQVQQNLNNPTGRSPALSCNMKASSSEQTILKSAPSFLTVSADVSQQQSLPALSADLPQLRLFIQGKLCHRETGGFLYSRFFSNFSGYLTSISTIRPFSNPAKINTP